MKKKLKQMKRRWRKLEKADQFFYGMNAVLVAANLIGVCCGNVRGLMTCLWVSLVIFIRCATQIEGRMKARRMYFFGKLQVFRVLRQCKYDLFSTHVDLAKMKGNYDDLKQKYNKLECDYHRLKKQSKSNGKTKTK